MARLLTIFVLASAFGISVLAANESAAPAAATSGQTASANAPILAQAGISQDQIAALMAQFPQAGAAAAAGAAARGDGIPQLAPSPYGPAGQPGQYPPPAPGLLPGLGGLSLNKGFNLEIPGLGGLFGGGLSPYPGGIAVPSPPVGLAATYGGPIGTGYITQTPWGAMKGVIGDLVIPIIVVAVGIFIIFGLIFLVKLAFGLKLDFLSNIADAISGKVSNRSKRNANEVSDLSENIDRLTTVIMSALTSQQCAQRTICELGSIVGKQSLLSKIVKSLPSTISSSESYGIFSNAASGKDDCSKYICGSSAKA